ncbi:MAG: carboxylesterase family protein, partial [Deinococcota bacterium]|nr:carboxylesterase family protein [Deinococcota bacterium]
MHNPWAATAARRQPPCQRFDLFLVALLAALCTWGAARSQAPVDCPSGVVATVSGWVCGVAQGGSPVRAFLGVPYAESTAGENRWRAPVPKAPWPGTWQADAFGPICP